MFSWMSRNKRTIFMHLGNLRRLLCFDCVLLLLLTDDEDESGSAPMAVKRHPIYRMLQLGWCVMNAVSTLIILWRRDWIWIGWHLKLWIWCWWFIGYTFFCWVHACKVHGENEREDNVGYEWCPSILFVTLCYRTMGDRSYDSRFNDRSFFAIFYYARYAIVPQLVGTPPKVWYIGLRRKALRPSLLTDCGSHSENEFLAVHLREPR